jgi:hypothetical protein
MESVKNALESQLNDLISKRREAMRKAAALYAADIRVIEDMLALYNSAKGERAGPELGHNRANTGDLFAETVLNLKPKEITKRLGKTTQDMVLEILQENPNGLVALEILYEVNRRWSLGLLRSSLSPQISRLKKKGKVKYSQGIWRFATPISPS